MLEEVFSSYVFNLIWLSFSLFLYFIKNERNIWRVARKEKVNGMWSLCQETCDNFGPDEIMCIKLGPTIFPML